MCTNNWQLSLRCIVQALRSPSGDITDVCTLRLQDKGKERNDSSAGAQSPPPDGRTPTRLHSKDNRNLLKRLLQSRGNNLTFGSSHSSTRPANAPKQRPSRRPIDITACRDEERYGITPETDPEAAVYLRSRWGRKCLKCGLHKHKPRQADHRKSDCRRRSNSHQP
ncbi:hypothetical protein CY34DRAFT_11742 [Suillus luteus UH-Slu-Lm8-n1]|uniref:Uncharacterized protein n=1 Tax=Suillus luteus UH-Slu-Lm8-n1 TaxID=930992 RepID=A0A0D0A0K8_9AGAM|nr:hypothetical protein CY34DRAFT_11742 [Suillus luteus UH-Slu-Lm8-n1]